METGTKISASAHVVLLGALMISNPFRGEPLPVSVQEVAVITPEAWAELTGVAEPPVVEAALPEPVEPEPTPEPVPPEPQPEPEPPAPPQVEPPAVVAPDPDPGPESVPEAADRVAPVPVPEPEAEADVADAVQEEVTPTPDAAEPQDEQEAAAPEAATTELLTEADEPSSAPIRSLRPPSRPAPREVVEAPEPEPTPDPVPEPEPAEDPVEAAVADVLENLETEVPAGPPLTGGELEALRVSVSSCWNVGALSTTAQDTKVTVFVAMNRDGTPDLDSIRMVGFEGGPEGAAARVYRSARSAIARCGRTGFPLPPEKYGTWQEIEMTFNPSGMFWR